MKTQSCTMSGRVDVVLSYCNNKFTNSWCFYKGQYFMQVSKVHTYQTENCQNQTRYINKCTTIVTGECAYVNDMKIISLQ